METEDGAGGHRKAKNTDYYTALWWSGWSLKQTQLFLHMAALPVGQAAEVRPALAFKGGGKEHQRGGPPAVSVVGQMFNFTPFFPTLEVIAARKRGGQNPAKQRLKGSVEQKRWPVRLILSGLLYFESKTIQPYLKSNFLFCFFFF